jgi:uncharacterized protein YbjT (DUF2867 family)
MTSKKIAVTGSTSDTGRVISGILKYSGHEVIDISRANGIDIDNQEVINNAFKGVEAAYLMVPFDMSAPDLHRREEILCANMAKAVEINKVKRVVVLSGANAYLKSGTSLGAAMLEDKINALNIPEVVHLRCGFFMENFLKGLGFAQQARSGIFQTAFRGNIGTPMIATKDVGNVAATILMAEPFAQPRVRELLGPRDYTMQEATHILGAAIGVPNLIYQQCSYDAALDSMMRSGASSSFAKAVIETARSFNSGKRWALEPWSVENTTSTTLEEFAEEAIETGGLY